MAKRELRTFDRYRYGKRSYLYPGYEFRASDGPYYLMKDEEGRRVRIPMNEPGVFTFLRYCEYGASKWIEAQSKGYGRAIIYVGRARPSPRIEGLRLSPHKIRIVSKRRKKNVGDTAALVQKTLFECDSDVGGAVGDGVGPCGALVVNGPAVFNKER